MNAVDDDADWTLRVTGRKDVALRARISPSNSGLPYWAAEAYWDGSFERPIEIVRGVGNMAPREWEQIDHSPDDATGAEMSSE